LIVGSMMSWLPLTTSVGWVMVLRSAKRWPRGWAHSVSAARWASAVCMELGGIHVNSSLVASVPEGPAGLLAALGRVEEQQEKVLHRRLGMAGDGRDVGLSVLELTATWRRADKDETAHQLPVAQRQGLRDAAADRETEEVDHAQAQATMKAAAPSPIASMVSGVSPVDAATPTLSNRNHWATTGEAVGHHRVPVVHPATEVLQEDERGAGLLTEPAVGEADAGGLDELGGCGGMGVRGHDDPDQGLTARAEVHSAPGFTRWGWMASICA
jgi:hypothetical protein